jgi:FkbM family methyltransferase
MGALNFITIYAVICNCDPSMSHQKHITNSLGKKIYFDPTDKRGEHLAVSDGSLAPLSLALWNTALRLRQWDLVVDVGCNYGEMLVSAELPVEPEVVAFEPNPKVLPYLRRTLSELGRPVKLIERAVADVAGDSAVFVIDEDWSGTSSLPRHIPEQVFGHNHKRTEVSVPVTTLDAEFAAHRPACVCVKIDVEGYEQAVLAGAENLFESAQHWAVVLEILHMRDHELSDLASRYALYVLNKQSMELVRLHGDSPEQIRQQMANDHLYTQDALIVSAPLLLERDDGILPPREHNVRNESAQFPQGPHTVASGDHGVTSSAPRRVVYTALIGGYERLNEQPIAASSAVEFICFTDDPELVSETWTIRLVEPRFPRDSIRSARYLKVMGPELLKDYDQSLWIDNTIQLCMPPETILDEWLTEADFAAPLHSFRDSVAGEFDAVETAGYDGPARIYEQMTTYAATRPSVLREKPYATGFIARRHTTEVCEAMRLWYEHILRYSRRDQLSLNYVLSVTGLPAAGIAIDLHKSQFHQWPISHGRKINVTQGRLGDVLKIPYVEIGRLENTVASLRTALAKEETLRNEMKNVEAALRAALTEQQNIETALRAELAEQKTVETALRAELAEQKTVETALRAELAEQKTVETALRFALTKHKQKNEERHQRLTRDLSIARKELNLLKSSSSWRMTGPLRRVGLQLSDRDRRTVRRIAKAGWWAITPHRLIERIRFLQARDK